MLSHRIVRFGVVGASNAALHFSVLNASFYLLHNSKIVSSIIATLFAMTYSFILNKNFVFKSKAALREEVIAFVAVTVSGVLLVHNIVFSFTVYLLAYNNLVPWLSSITGGKISHDFIIINVSTIIGAMFALLWNYNGYKRFVFTSDEVKDEFENHTA